MDTPSKNYFIGIDLSKSPLLQEIYPIIYFYQSKLPKNYHFINPNNYHVTFKYFGPIEDFTNISNTVELITQNQPVFPLKLLEIQTGFGHEHNVAAILVEKTPLQELSLLLHSMLGAPQNNHFSPHITIAKSTSKILPEEDTIFKEMCSKFPKGTIIVDSLSLMHRTGDVYDIDANFELNQSMGDLMI